MDVSFLQSVFEATGPFATVCADVTHTSENADTELDRRVRGISERLAEQGAPEPVIEAVRGRLLEGNDGGGAGTLKGRAGGAAAGGSAVPHQAPVGAPPPEGADRGPRPGPTPGPRPLPGRPP